jgi:hypothetical protein
MTENNSTPESTPLTTPAADAPVDSAPATVRSADNPFPAPKKSRTRTLLIAGGSVLAAAVLAGGGFAVGAAITDDMDDDDDDRASSASDDDRGAADDASSTGGASDDMGTESASELNDIIAAASESAEGDAVEVDANRDGSWDVTFETSAGDETEVRVAEDGTAEVVSTDAADAEDAAPLGVLDVETVDALVAAAMAEVEGKITGLEIDDDTASPFDVSVVQANGRMISLDLDADMKVLSINAD